MLEPRTSAMLSAYSPKSKMADLISFVSKREIDAKKEEKRKAREEILKKASVFYSSRVIVACIIVAP